MLKENNFDRPYTPSLHEFLIDIQIYDREETLGDELEKYDINVKKDREQVIITHILNSLSTFLSYRHRLVLLEKLEVCLADQEHDFSVYFQDDYDECISMAWTSEQINCCRGFYEDIFRLAKIHWHDDLAKAALENRVTW